jgi:hypothetical protein
LTTLDEIRNTTAARFLGMTRRGASALRAHDWSVREAAAIGSDVTDQLAIRRWEQKRMTADVRLVVRYADGAAPVAFSATESAAESLRSFGEPALITPPSARIKASLFASDDDAFAVIVDDTFFSMRGLVHALDEHQRDVQSTDAETYAESGLTPEPATPHATLIHAIIVTSAPLAVLSDNDRIATRPTVRLIRTNAASADRDWLDIVHADAFESYVETITRHYANAMKKRRFS